MQRPLEQPGLLLVATGLLLGAFFPLGKLAATAGVPSLLWAALISLGAAAVLGLAHGLLRRPMPVTSAHLRYFTITAIVSYAIPNTLVLLAIPHLGSGLTAIFYALSPIATTLLSRLAGLRAPRRLEYLGIGIGVIGALLAASERGEAGEPAAWLWIGLGLLIPVSLSAGNVYRSIDWPADADPMWLAIGSNAAAALLLLVLAAATGDLGQAGAIAAIPGAAALQIATAAAMFVFYFRLQKFGGPVTLSQIGIAAAGVGVLAASLLFGERYAAPVWWGLALIGTGLGLTVLARRGA